MPHHGRGHYYFPPRQTRRNRIAGWFKAHKFMSILTGTVTAGLIVSLVAFLIALALNKVAEATPTILWLGGSVFWVFFWSYVIMYYIQPIMKPDMHRLTRGTIRLVSSTSSQIVTSIRSKFRK